MSSVQALREFINERLTAAAAEIFTVFEETVVRYEEEINRQRRLLEIVLKPQIKLHRTDLQQHHDCREEQPFKQETDCLEQEEPEPPLIQEEPEEPGLLQLKEEQEEPEPSQIKDEREEPRLLQFKDEHEDLEPLQTEELGTVQEGEQLMLKVEGDSFRVSSVEERGDISDPQEDLGAEQILSHDSVLHDVKQHLDSESAINAELKQISTFRSDRVENFPESEKQTECEKLKMFPCKTCGDSFRQQSSLINHMKIHRGEKSYPNETRDKRLGILMSPVKTRTAKKQYFCETCGKSWNYPSKLTSHMRTHTGEKPYSCQTCGKKCSDPSSLKSHMRIHTGEKPYACDICGKSWHYPSKLRIHMRTHTGEKPYSCVTCGKSCSDASSLRNHVRTHTGEKPYTCQVCWKSFSQQNNLLRHMKTHKDEKS